MKRKITMGNLFSGSGTWELVAKMLGMEVLFEAEIEPFPVEIEKVMFPEAIQLGDVSKTNGADIPIVDVFTNSSPCQSLSVAGKREGFEGESGLFREAVRIFKEMREHDKELSDGRADEHIRPRYFCWENVPGAFSSSKGEDFRVVLEEIAKIADPNTTIPLPDKGKWSYAGVVDAPGCQIAWRTMDAQYFGVAQRRRRVFLVADFGGRRAGEILLKSESMSWDFKTVAETFENTSLSIEERIDEAGQYLRSRLGGNGEAVEQ